MTDTSNTLSGARLRRRGRRAGMIAGGALLLGALAPATAQASKTPEGEHKVTICHATDSRTNPYVIITVDVASILGTRGHDGHDGPVFHAGLAKHEKWGDVIPAFDYGDGYSYAGQNWNQGAAIEACGAQEL